MVQIVMHSDGVWHWVLFLKSCSTFKWPFLSLTHLDILIRHYLMFFFCLFFTFRATYPCSSSVCSLPLMLHILILLLSVLYLSCCISFFFFCLFFTFHAPYPFSSSVCSLPFMLHILFLLLSVLYLSCDISLFFFCLFCNFLAGYTFLLLSFLYLWCRMHWLISLHATDDAIAKLYATYSIRFSQVEGNGRHFSHTWAKQSRHQLNILTVYFCLLLSDHNNH